MGGLRQVSVNVDLHPFQVYLRSVATPLRAAELKGTQSMSDTTDYVVLTNSSKHVVIARNGYEGSPQEGLEKIGTFSLSVDPLNAQTSGGEISSHTGDHAFVNEARKVLAEHLGKDERDLDRLNYVYMDRASNAPAHDEVHIATDDLPVVDENLDPDVSTQAGGVPGIGSRDPSETEPNGVSTIVERTDEGSTDQTSEMPGGDEQSSKATIPDSSGTTGAGADPLDPEKAKDNAPKSAEGNVISEELADKAKEAAEGSNQEEKAETVAQLKERVSKMTDKAELEALYAEEQNGAKRTTALKAIEDRAAELEA